MPLKPGVYSDKMRDEWNQRSRKNAFHYIASERPEWSEEEFLLSGERDVAEVLDAHVAELRLVPAHTSILEIGCGVGRMTHALAARFASVDAVDISSEMISRAKEMQARHGVANARFQLGSGSDLKIYSDASIDFAFSYIVLQHVPDLAVILNYVSEIGRVLKPGGHFRFQVNGYHRRSLPLGYCLMWGTSPTDRSRALGIKNRLHVRFGKLNSWRGVPVSALEMRKACAAAGLTITALVGAGTRAMWVNGTKNQPLPVSTSAAVSAPASNGPAVR